MALKRNSSMALCAVEPAKRSKPTANVLQLPGQHFGVSWLRLSSIAYVCPSFSASSRLLLLALKSWS